MPIAVDTRGKPTQPMHSRDFPPQTLRQYALLADGERGALVGPRGDIAFLCAPRWHDDAVFARLLGGSGCYAVTPTDRHHVWGGHYEHGSLIWRSRWVTIALRHRVPRGARLPGGPRPAGAAAAHRGARGPPSVHVELECRAEFGARVDDLRPHARARVGRAAPAPLQYRWTRRASCIREQPTGGCVSTSRFPKDSTTTWSSRSRQGRLPTAPYPDPARRGHDTEVPGASATTRRPVRWHPANPCTPGQCCVVSPAPTAAWWPPPRPSLPERADKGRNYDYRYAWIRDQCYAGQAAAALGAI